MCSRSFLHRRLADDERARDLGVRLTVGGAREDGALPRREGLQDSVGARLRGSQPRVALKLGEGWYEPGQDRAAADIQTGEFSIHVHEPGLKTLACGDF
jgi:hypothetical protein